MRTYFCLLAGFFCFLPGHSLLAQTATPAEINADKSPELSELEKEFSNLPEQKRIDFVKHYQEANRLFNQKRIFEAFNEIDEARKIFDKNPDLFNLMASCYVEFRDFKNADIYYKKAAALAPKSPVIEFNIAELLFVTRKWEECMKKMNEVLTLLPKNDITTRRIVEFKIMLCQIALGQNDKANEWANKYDPLLDDSPFYYYANASINFRDKNMVKAEEFLQTANHVFANPAILNPWQDTLIEFGYIASFYGGEEQPEAK